MDERAATDGRGGPSAAERSTAARGLPLLAALLLAAPASGQETREYEIPDLEQPPGIIDYVEWRLTAANRFVGSADYGTFSTTAFQPEGRLRVQVPLSRSALVRVLATGRLVIQDFDGTSNLFGTGPSSGDPYDDLVSWNVRVQLAQVLPEWLTIFSDDEQWAVLVQGFAKSSWEVGSPVRYGMRGGGSLGVFYRYSERFEIAAGVSVGSKLLGGVGVSPYFEFDWKLARNWRLRSYGAGLQLERLLGDNLRVFLRARFESAKYRLADRGGDIGRGAVRLRGVPVGIGLRWNAFRKLRFTVVAGSVVWGQIKVENEDDDDLSRVTGDPAPFVSLRIDLRD